MSLAISFPHLLLFRLRGLVVSPFEHGHDLSLSFSLAELAREDVLHTVGQQLCQFLEVDVLPQEWAQFRDSPELGPEPKRGGPMGPNKSSQVVAKSPK